MTSNIVESEHDSASNTTWIGKEIIFRSFVPFSAIFTSLGLKLSGCSDDALEQAHVPEFFEVNLI